MSGMSGLSGFYIASRANCQVTKKGKPNVQTRQTSQTSHEDSEKLQKRWVFAVTIKTMDVEMNGQLSLPGFMPAPVRPRRRRLWEAELARLVAIHRDQRARDRQASVAEIGRLAGAIADLQHRLADLERGLGVADLAAAPRTRAALRAFAAR